MESAQKQEVATIWKEGPNRTDSSTELIAFLPLEACDLPAADFEKLQASYHGSLSVEHENRRIIVGRRFTSHKSSDAAYEMGRFRDRIKEHLGFDSFVQ